MDFISKLILTVPLNVFTTLYSVLVTLIPVLPNWFHHHALLNGTDSAALNHALFRYKKLYSTSPPPFYQNSYKQLINDVKSKLIFALVYLHSEDHQDTFKFCQQTLADSDFLNLLQEHEMALYFGPMDHPEPFEVSSLLLATGYPFLALIALTSVKGVTRPTVVFRSEGYVPANILINKLQKAIQTHGSFISTIRQERQMRETDRTMRAMQEQAYKASMLRDRERQRVLEANSQTQRLLEEQRVAKRQLLLDELNKRRSARITLRAQLHNTEPSEVALDTAQVQIRMPNGSRLRRTFRDTDSVRKLYEFVFSQDPSGEDTIDDEEWVDQQMCEDEDEDECEDVDGFKFVLADPFPRKEHRNLDITICDAGLRKGNVVVEL